jgi:glycosyltransferase involved in cell wall biosynthesis
LRILLVSQMYPGAESPEFGAFVRELDLALEARGHTIERAVVDRREGGRKRYAELLLDARRKAGTFDPDVVYAHMLVPSGLVAALASSAPLVVTAHGQDVDNIGAIPGVAPATRWVVRKASAVIAVSGWLRDRLVQRVPAAAAKAEVVDCGVDLERFAPADAGAARREVGWEPGGTAFLCLGSLIERKNVLRLARAFERRGEGGLAFVGGGPLRPALEGRAGITLVDPVPHGRVARWVAAADVVCQPSLVEPFGLAALEAMAAGRSVVGTTVGGQVEFVTPEAGVLVPPEDDEALADALEAAASMARPNLAARAAAEAHDVRRQAERIEAILARAARDRPA